jgi:hypothetical protein
MDEGLPVTTWLLAHCRHATAANARPLVLKQALR